MARFARKPRRLGSGSMRSTRTRSRDQPGQRHSYSTGSLASGIKATRDQAVEHNIECIRIGEQLGAKDLTVWVGDGTTFSGQQDLARSLDRYLDSAAQIYKALPDDWRMLIEHKMFEPAFYSTVISTRVVRSSRRRSLVPKAKCLHRSRASRPECEYRADRLRDFIASASSAGFHFNDSKYGDDDLDAGSINPHQLFLVFNELVEAELNPREGFRPAYMIDQSHNVTDPIESMLSSAETITACYAKALLVDRSMLHIAQEVNDPMLAFRTLRAAYDLDVTPIVAMARFQAGGAIDTIKTYRASHWRARKAQERPPVGLGAGIV